MNLQGILFYLFAALIVGATALAATRRNLVHAVVCLVTSFFGSAMLFYLLGAPLLAMLEILIYVGAIMILFLFIVMMLRQDAVGSRGIRKGKGLVVAGLGLAVGAAGVLLVLKDPASEVPLQSAVASPQVLGQYVFQRHWLAVEIVSLLLLVALAGALYLGRAAEREAEDHRTEGQR